MVRIDGKTELTVAGMVENIVGCKWSMQVLRAIQEGHVRPSAIQRACAGLSAKVMNERLRKMQRFGILAHSARREGAAGSGVSADAIRPAVRRHPRRSQTPSERSGIRSETIVKFRYAVLFAVMVAACDDDPDERPTDADTLATAIVDTNADSSAGAREQIGFERSRTFDFDGDGTDEIVSLSGSGPAWDSLNMTLRIQRTDNTVLWTDTFSTAMHTGLDPDPALTREQIDAQVRRELEQVLGNQSIVSTRENFDSNMDLRSAAPWMTEEEFARFQEDVVGRPMFRYYKGGESNVGITWSGVLKRFVQTLGCC